jgi:hypothetical protein
VIPLLQEKWPLAFPTEYYLVKPLATSVTRVISEAMGWNLYYARGVLSAACCQCGSAVAPTVMLSCAAAYVSTSTEMRR